MAYTGCANSLPLFGCMAEEQMEKLLILEYMAMRTKLRKLSTAYRLLLFRLCVLTPLAVLFIVAFITSAGLRTWCGDNYGLSGECSSALHPLDYKFNAFMCKNGTQSFNLDENSLLEKVYHLEKRLDTCEKKLQRLSAAGKLLCRVICSTRGQWSRHAKNESDGLSNAVSGILSEHANAGMDRDNGCGAAAATKERHAITLAIRELQESLSRPSVSKQEPMTPFADASPPVDVLPLQITNR